MFSQYQGELQQELHSIRDKGLFKDERVIGSPQAARVQLADGRWVINLCANNYLGLSNHPRLIEAAKAALDQWGFGLSSVRFICGTQGIHRRLESAVSDFLGTEDTILYAACFDANGGVFEPLLGADDAVISDELNHASIIDGIRLCKAKRFRFKNADLEDLESKLKEARSTGARQVMIATDGVFSMDGTIAPLDGICDLAEKYQALVMVDDCHATGFLGASGRGTHEYRDCMGRVDILTGTFGKALGGASGGYVSARREIVELLRQRSRPYLFSNTVAPAICGATLAALEMLGESTQLRDRLWANTSFFRRRMLDEGFQIPGGQDGHAIVPVMLGDAKLAQTVSARLLEKGVYAVGFFYPVVAEGKARIRTQVSAAHSEQDLEGAVQSFVATRSELGI